MANPSDIHADYGRWKTLVPFLYDWFAHHRLMWPSLSCRWGAVLERNEFKHKQRLYLSEQTDGSAAYPNTLVVTNVDVVKRRVAAAEHLTFEEESRSPFVKSWKKIIHPGEVNKIREFEASPNLLVTHTDAPELFVWDVDKQPHRKTGGIAGAGGSAGDTPPALLDPSKPDLVLTGHEENAEFALAVRADAFEVASGGKDQKVLIWNVEDHDGGSVWSSGNGCATSNPNPNASPSRPTRASFISGSPSLEPRFKLVGHQDTVEDVAFHPGSSGRELCSVACDKSLLFWDVRAGSSPAHAVRDAHTDDLHTVDWSSLDEHFVVTGSADSTVKLWDKRKLSGSGNACVVHTFSLHTEGITTVQWCPDQRGVFASGAEDGYLNVWDILKIGAPQTLEQQKNAPPEIMFQHAGHRTQVSDFQWNPLDPWTIASVSSGDGGNTLQMWRMNDLIYRAEGESLAELEKHKDIICGVKIQSAEYDEKKEGKEKEEKEGEEGVPAGVEPMVE